MSLPIKWIERLFSMMSVIYGSKFTTMWANADHELMKEVWAEKLAGFSHRPDIIRDVLNDMTNSGGDDPWPPTLPEFLEMCRVKARRMGNQEFALPAPELRQLENKHET